MARLWVGRSIGPRDRLGWVTSPATGGDVAVYGKSNENTLLPTLLGDPGGWGAIVTMDAIGCQKEIVARIRDAGADSATPDPTF
jgi:hypothetical protein